MNNETHASQPVTCPVCQIGRIHLRTVTYMQVIAGSLLSAPNTLAWECDVCHNRDYDNSTISLINALAGHSGKSERRPRFHPQTAQSERGRVYRVNC